MSPVPASAITIADGEITLDAELLAPAGQHPITLYVGGQFTGGCDIAREMNTSGELQAIIRANHNTATLRRPP